MKTVFEFVKNIWKFSINFKKDGKLLYKSTVVYKMLLLDLVWRYETCKLF